MQRLGCLFDNSCETHDEALLAFNELFLTAVAATASKTPSQEGVRGINENNQRVVIYPTDLGDFTLIEPQPGEEFWRFQTSSEVLDDARRKGTMRKVTNGWLVGVQEGPHLTRTTARLAVKRRKRELKVHEDRQRAKKRMSSRPAARKRRMEVVEETRGIIKVCAEGLAFFANLKKLRK